MAGGQREFDYKPKTVLLLSRSRSGEPSSFIPSLPIHHQRFEEPALIELILMLAVCGIGAFSMFGATLVLFLVWWVRVYRRKGFVMDGYVFLSRGHQEAVRRSGLISDLNEQCARSHGGAFVSA